MGSSTITTITDAAVALTLDGRHPERVGAKGRIVLNAGLRVTAVVDDNPLLWYTLAGGVMVEG